MNYVFRGSQASDSTEKVAAREGSMYLIDTDRAAADEFVARLVTRFPECVELRPTPSPVPTPPPSASAAPSALPSPAAATPTPVPAPSPAAAPTCPGSS